MHLQRITPCLWFDDQAEEAVRFYSGIFARSRAVRTTRYGEVGREIHGGRRGPCWRSSSSSTDSRSPP